MGHVTKSKGTEHSKAWIASLKLHLPDWLSAYAPLTFGRVRTMHLNLVAYAWLSVAGIAAALCAARLARFRG